MDKPLTGKTVAVLVANGFEELQMTEPQRALINAGATVKIVSPENSLVNGWLDTAWGHYFPIDVALSEMLAADYDALLIPGGVRGFNKLATNPHTNRVLRGMIDGGKATAMLGHSVSLLAKAERAGGKTVIAMDDHAAELTTAGATVTPADSDMVVDGKLLTALDSVDPTALTEEVLKLVGASGDLAEAA